MPDSTPTRELIEGIRVTINDNDHPYRFPDATILRALNLVFRGGQLAGGYALSVDKGSVAPELPPKEWMLAILLGARTFVRVTAESVAYSRRALSERFEGQKDLLRAIDNDILLLQEGGGFMSSWVDLTTWRAGVSGAQFWQRLYNVAITHRGTINVDATINTSVVIQ